MRSRLAILGMLVFGLVLSTGGAGLAVSGFTSPNNAAISQYGDDDDDSGDDDVLGQEDSGGPGGGQDGSDDDGTAGAQDDAAQPTRQIEAGAQGGGDDEQLPFTGFAAIPILLGGVALLSTGLALRRRSGEDA